MSATFDRFFFENNVGKIVFFNLTVFYVPLCLLPLIRIFAQYCPQSGARNPIVPSLEFPVCIYSAFGLLYAWSCFATWFVLPNWIGIAICSVAIVAAYAFTFVVHHQMAAQFSEAVTQVCNPKSISTQVFGQ